MNQMRRPDFFIFMFVAGFFCFTACNSPFTNKRTGYFKISFPEREYQSFDRPDFPYAFEYPVYAEITRDSSYFDDDDPYWINVDFPTFNGRIFLSYKEIGGKSHYRVRAGDGKYRDSVAVNQFDQLVKDAYNLSFKNDIKAYSIDDSLMKTPDGLTGIYFKLTGNVATANQFFLSDTTQHFIRGALYFNTTPNEDSLSVVNDFLEVDLKHLINTMHWKGN